MLRGKRVFITGGAGFLGQRLARQLLARGHLSDTQGRAHSIDQVVLVDIPAGRLFGTPTPTGSGPQSLTQLAQLDVPLAAVAPVRDAPGSWLAAAGTGLALLLAACGGAGDDAAAPSASGPGTTASTGATAGSTDEGTESSAFPVTVTSGQEPDLTELTLDEAPASIVSISPSATEMLYAVGAGDQVVAVDSFSYYPPEAPVTDLSGYEPNVEAILGYGPDLVVAGAGGGVSGVGRRAGPELGVAAGAGHRVGRGGRVAGGDRLQ